MTGINDVGSAVTINKAIDAIGFEHNFDEIDANDRTTVAGEDMGYIMTILSKLYDRPQLSAFREYLSNAVDANIVAARETGAPRPAVEVTFPENAVDTLLIRDFGLGLDHNEMVRAFARYGASDKRDDNTTTGGFGLGSKSALAFSAHFKIASTKLVDGEYVTEFAIMTPPGIKFAGSRKGVFNETGTVVEIPADGFQWETELSMSLRGELFAGTPDNHIRFRVGSQAEWIDYKGREARTIGAAWMIDEIPGAYMQVRATPSSSTIANQQSNLNVFVSGINYPVGIQTNLSRASRELTKYLNFYLPPGSVSFTPARDSIQFDDITKNILNIINEYLENITPSNIFSTVSDAQATMAQRYDAIFPLLGDTHEAAAEVDAMAPGNLPNFITPGGNFFYGQTDENGRVFDFNTGGYGRKSRLTNEFDDLFFLTYNPATLDLTNAVHGLTEKIVTNRIKKLIKGKDIYKGISRIFRNNFIVVVPVSHASEFVKNFNSKKVESLNNIFDKMTEVDKQIIASRKNVSVDAKNAGKKVSVSHIGRYHDKDINEVVILKDLQDPSYRDRVVGWYYGSEERVALNPNGLESIFSNAVSTLQQSGTQAHLITKYLNVKASDPILIKLRKGAKAEKTLEELGFSGLRHVKDVYEEAINTFISELDGINSVLAKDADALELANLIGGVTSPVTHKAVTDFKADFSSQASEYYEARRKGIPTPLADAFLSACNTLENIFTSDKEKTLGVIHSTPNSYYGSRFGHGDLITAVANYTGSGTYDKGMVSDLRDGSAIYKIAEGKQSHVRNRYVSQNTANDIMLPALFEKALLKDLLNR